VTSYVTLINYVYIVLVFGSHSYIPHMRRENCGPIFTSVINIVFIITIISNIRCSLRQEEKTYTV